MSRKKHTHLRGERGQAFADKIRGIPLEQILCVSLDIHKYFHVVMLHNALGEIVTTTFEIDIFQAGFDQLCRAIDEAVARTNAQVVLVGMEPTGHYFENLARHLHQRPQPVTLINSFAVSRNREQQMMRREKDDEIDVAAVGDLLRRGEGTPFQPVSGIYLEMQHLSRVRLSRVKIQTALKNQIIGHLDRLFPGLVIQGQVARERYEPLFVADFWSCQTLQHLIRVCPDPRQLATMAPEDLRAAFHAHSFALGVKTAARIITYSQKVLLSDPEVIAIRRELLAHDLALLAEVERLIAELEDRLHALLQQTPYWVWTKVRGLSLTQVASLAAAIGDPSHYTYAAQVFRRSGLVSGRNDSGTRRHKGKGKRVVKTGDVYLRRALMTAIMSLIRHQPVLQDYFNELHRTKHAGVARVATARRAIGILWAMQRDQHSRTLVLKRGAKM
ncbi:MAG: IS110 family transposase [Anaerolineae bacterium]|nr:IS110 family transposase [Anaerolineae bacterium]